MKLEKWLKANDVRLVVHIKAELDPIVRSPCWRCEILGLLNVNPARNRPAVFIVKRSGGIADVVAYANTPLQAYANAVNQLPGLRINVILLARDETLTFPEKLTP